MRTRIRLSVRQSISLVTAYAWTRLKEQLHALWLIVAYLVLFQTLVLGIPIAEAGKITAGLFLTLLGLTLFMEGLFLGIMPLGENVGVKLPLRTPLAFTLSFAFVLGLLATFAEPAIRILQMAGTDIKPYKAPLLYQLLNHRAGELVLAVGLGVALAVALGLLRILYNISLKPFLMITIPVLIALTIYADWHPLLSPILGLAWDCGAITTGPVTVPLVLALGIGISRMSQGEGEGSGFGIVTLASLLPVLMVLLLAIFLMGSAPMGGEQSVFYESLSPADKLMYALKTSKAETFHSSLSDSVLSQIISGLKAVGLLVIPLVTVLVLIIREKIARIDEVILGLVFAIVGLGLFGAGMEAGLDTLGRQIGSRLPSGFMAQKIPEQKITFHNFTAKKLLYAKTESGNNIRFFYGQVDNQIKKILYEQKNHNATAKTYTYVPEIGPIVGKPHGISGKFFILAFAILLGFGATLAEPALNALGHTVEELTVGTFQKRMLMNTVALGVGIGICFGVARLIWNLPLSYILVPAYMALLPITALSSEDYVNIGFDSAGVTTGPVTVPLVLSMGLGISGATYTGDGFGILALASVFPILAVLLMGIIVSKRRARLLR